MAEQGEISPRRNEPLQLPDYRVTVPWTKWHYERYLKLLFTKTTGKPVTRDVKHQILKIMELTFSLIGPAGFPVNNQFLVYLAEAEKVERDTSTLADKYKLSNPDDNTMKKAIASNTLKCFQQVKQPLLGFGVKIQDLWFYNNSAIEGQPRWDKASDLVENHYPSMREFWGRLPIKAIYYFRTGEYKFNKDTPQNLALLFGQFHDGQGHDGEGRYFLYRNYTPDFMDGFAVGNQLCRVMVDGDVTKLLEHFSERDEVRVLTCERNGWPLTYDESWDELQNLRIDPRLEWAREDDVSNTMCHGNEFGSKNFQEQWSISKRTWFWSKQPFYNQLMKKCTGQKWAGELAEECEKEPPEWLVSSKTNQPKVSQYYGPLMEDIQAKKKRGQTEPKRLNVADKQKPVWAC